MYGICCEFGIELQGTVKLMLSNQMNGYDDQSRLWYPFIC